MTLFPRENLRSLANVGFSNVVPALPSGTEAKRLLSQTLVPGIRVLMQVSLHESSSFSASLTS